MAAQSRYKIATLGSHSALQILKGAKDEGFSTLCVATSDRVSLYKRFNFIDKIIEISSFADFPKIENLLIKEKAIIIPHGSFVAYLGLEENKKMRVPYFGNKEVLDWESDRLKQREWLEKANVPVPRRFANASEIDAPVLVKSYGAAGGHGYFFAKNKKEFSSKIKKFKSKNYIIQEYVIGVSAYIHYFYSTLTNQLEILSIDRRYETNVDSLGRIPSHNQQGLGIEPSFVVVGNSPLVLRESLLADAFKMAERTIETSKKLMKDGLFGPFCLEAIITPQQEFFVIEISCRIVAGTNLFINSSPYASLYYDKEVSTGRRIAMEIKEAIKRDQLKKILN
ncbi:5-formaminoimidazole-4-carboxamide-1-(beta)-D-ribofuranosyl 5'-monophosphate synthetase [Candidatus Curtissbacteria bacterium RIFCSPHIGHO2_01_FULL_41_44]|uniref:5-formaminoimidazole-4-carboxamide-1-(Beta)-D-ribofuranosyl 5'-monophosphate synthetase n=1 Tax=Candidatus Curtissbacteria bacterium RIFCSPLOWO2_01_FULL_42_50 TaxID=1797730 RepID=A0A1F5H528_9BACT|nr:MAG: 5-formaminoimidazole-4-carboxamide-1-(beta)-D-ribofuranosyl 5'-monophosphate synthetase [Candidatus Curtissbacteria bacterium RIFCSPHIGHO2_02_FULL_42_58]OGD93838.1 MAG: 5-formaminoimidazole-4-carboxamide-1-(beta)-D-ribofuranosyl 5'-monophosphate synthetase [Candidatus Curtissbacteria bacterium RIFCSPHIGHO2_01_FULL_41_44]OGD97486.1 MAG: 5-formaminoimidazole-4-carboxamide-1-(beta)-D-ribofuranosyl 5'-monophosphate synthetase [Candidatus Curtissbacteria bacterium RIFCSPHIGHO2_12_FULL_42_33]O